ncbi:nicotinate phosphoribosyltransferase [bacterium]|nr:MAG: nicotinate phosphoribosyltransferase [bacterium]
MRGRSLLLDLYELTMAASYFARKVKLEATFDLFVRNLPHNRSFLVACGLQKAIRFLEDFSFGPSDIDFLKKKAIFKDDFLDYLKGLRFTGSVYALPEGTVFFPNEPILRVSAPILEAQIMESYLLNTINVATTLCSKASRVVLAAGERGVYDFSLRRTQGCSAALAASRSSYIAGCSGTSNALGSALYGIPAVGTMAHSFVMSFKSELESFRAYASTFPDNTTLLVDTYSYATGIDNAITVGRELALKGYRLKAIRLDSGDLVKISRLARVMLDKAGLSCVNIFASGNLDEYKIEKLIGKGARIDSFGVGTNMGVSSDAPYLDVIYKLSQIDDARSGAQPVMKLSEDKITYPGKKQVFRVCDKKGFYGKDIIGLEGEAVKGEPLMVNVMEKGKIKSPLPSLDKIRDFARNNISLLPARYKKLTQAESYPVSLSKGLSRLIAKVRSRAIAS